MDEEVGIASGTEGLVDDALAAVPEIAVFELEVFKVVELVWNCELTVAGACVVAGSCAAGSCAVAGACAADACAVPGACALDGPWEIDSGVP